MLTPETFALSQAEKLSPLWQRLAYHMTDRLAIARLRNDTIQPEHDTMALRGEIRALKLLLALGETRPIAGGG